MTEPRIYLDHAATTPVDQRVIDAMLPYFNQRFGNPSSIHRWGQQAEAAVERARLMVAEGLNCSPDEIIFTGCGSESDNLAVRGAALAARRETGANHVLVSAVEHHAVLNTAVALADEDGFESQLIPPDEYGQITPEAVASLLRPDTAVVSVMTANNEIGTVNPISRIGAKCREQGIVFHTDAVQAGAHLPLDTQSLKVDLLSLGAHKFYGPKGVGVLYVRNGTALVPTLTGGGQEAGLRAGTHNVPLIVGMAEAYRLALDEQPQHNQHAELLRDRLLKEIPDRIPDTRITGHPALRLPNHASFVIHGVDGNQLLAALDVAGFACSSGSACKTGDPEPSDVLTAIGLDHDWALGSLRITVGRDTSQEDIARLMVQLPELVQRLRAAESLQA
jgi:cysteine desulfurase